MKTKIKKCHVKSILFEDGEAVLPLNLNLNHFKVKKFYMSILKTNLILYIFLRFQANYFSKLK